MQMGLFLHPLELPEQKHRGIFEEMLLAVFPQQLGLLPDHMSEDSVVDGNAVDVVDLLDQLETHGTPDASVPWWRGGYM
jgi:hypothetical protein